MVTTGDNQPIGADGETAPPVDLVAVATAFELAPLSVEAFHEGAGGAWRLHSATGEQFSMKLISAPASDWWLAQLRMVAKVETRAVAAGIDMPIPVQPHRPAVGHAARVGDHLVIVHHWVDHGPHADADALSAWLGRTLAALHRLFPDPAADDAELQRAYGVHPVRDWRVWIDDADRAGLPWAGVVADALPVIEEATARSLAALGNPLPRRLTHRDVNPPNVLHTAGGPVLCDFGYAGLDVAWYETVATAIAFGPSVQVPGVIDSYLAAGGQGGPRTVDALARTTGTVLNWLAFTMWLSLGHRPITEQTREDATRRIPGVACRLVSTVNDLDRTRRRLFGC